MEVSLDIRQHCDAVIENAEVGDVIVVIENDDWDSSISHFKILNRMKKHEDEDGIYYTDNGYQLINLTSNTICDVKGKTIKKLLNKLFTEKMETIEAVYFTTYGELE